MQQQSFLKENKNDPLCCHIWMYDLLKKRQLKLLLIYSESEVISMVVSLLNKMPLFKNFSMKSVQTYKCFQVCATAF